MIILLVTCSRLIFYSSVPFSKKVDSLRRELTSAASEAEAQRLNAKEKREAEMAKGRAALRIAEDANVALRSETAAQLMAMQVIGGGSVAMCMYEDAHLCVAAKTLGIFLSLSL